MPGLLQTGMGHGHPFLDGGEGEVILAVESQIKQSEFASGLKKSLWPVLAAGVRSCQWVLEVSKCVLEQFFLCCKDFILQSG